MAISAYGSATRCSTPCVSRSANWPRAGGSLRSSDTTGAVCRAFDMNPEAPGFAAACHPLAEDHVVIEVGEGVGDEEADLVAAGVVAGALRAVGLATAVELRGDAAAVVASH